MASKYNFSKNAYFPTLVFSMKITEAEELNQHLLKQIYDDRDSGDGIYRSNVKELGGWHSEINLHRLKEYRDLVRHIKVAMKHIEDDLTYSKKHELRIGSMWSIINPKGGMNISHVHPGCMWSGVYYVQTPEKCGNIEFIEPRTVHLMHQATYENKGKRPRDCWTKVNFKPVAGKMIIFPAWLYHAVRPNATPEEGDKANRVIISFNINQHSKKKN